MAIAGGLACAQLSEPGRYEGRVIADVVYDPPSQPVDPRDLNKAQVFTKGSPYHDADAAAAIDGLFATGYYDDIQIDVQPENDQVVVRIVTQNAWFAGHISIQGSVKD